MSRSAEVSWPLAQSLDDRVALVTGASRGIGRAIAKALAARGAKIAINYSRREDAARTLCEEIQSASGTAIAVAFDVADAQQVEVGIKRVVEEFGGLHILVNNAGISVDSLLLRAQEQDWQRTIDINLKGAFLCSRACARHLLRAKADGRIINISSVVGEQGNGGQTMYSASKAGLIGMTKSLAFELAGRGITVNAIAPGYIETDMTDSSLTEEGHKALLAKVPLGRIGQPEDVAEAAVFLATPAAAYITGHVLRVNGGLYI